MMAIHGVTGSFAKQNSVLQELKSQDSVAGILGAAAGALIDRPSSVKDLWKESEASLMLTDRLAKFLVGVIGQLPT